MSARLRNSVAAGLALGAAALLAAGCLFSIDDKPEDGGVIGGGRVSLTSVDFEEDGLDPPGDDGDETDEGPFDFGPNCTALAECVCVDQPADQQIECLEAIAELSEDDCLEILESDYEECLPDAGD